ncbi:MAG TPA: MYXO-CTERM sorting domain-containing protein [Kofleriaceae bacterium]
MRTVILSVLVLAAVPRLARADGWIHCSGPDKSCNASGADSGSVGSGLLMIGAVAYGLARRKRR